MDRVRSRLLLVAVVSFVVTCGYVFSQDVPTVEEGPAKALSGVWKDAKPASRLAAEEVARQDAYRKLTERIFGLSLDAQTDVYDLALQSRAIDTAVRGRLKGMREIKDKITYYPDGRIAIPVKVTIREVVEIIESTYKRVEKNQKLVSEETLENVKRENRDKDIVVLGWGALKGSQGLEKVKAMRAAEVDCYARIAARVLGMDLTAETKVRDFVLSSDRIRTKVTACLLNGVQFTNYKFLDDGTCEATGKITIREVVEVLTRTYRRYVEDNKVVKLEDIQNLERKDRDLVIEETGKGAVSTTVAAAEPFAEQKTAFEQVLRVEKVIRKEIGAE